MAPSVIANLATAKKIGFIVPSSNTAVETMTISILATLKANIIPIFTRIRVLTLGTDSASKAQFNEQAFMDAAQLLADAGADAILWNGTSGMFIGAPLSADEALAAKLTTTTSIPCSTTTLATIGALTHLDLKNISLAVPYTPSLTEKLTTFFTTSGYTVGASICLTPTPPTNLAIAKSTDEEISSVVRRAVTPETKAVLVACTNWPGTHLAAELERELGVYVLDSIAVTVWWGLRMVGFEGTGVEMEEWGRLLGGL